MRNGCVGVYSCDRVFMWMYVRAYIRCLARAKPEGFTNTIVWNIRAPWQEVALAPVINELKFGVAMLSRFFSLVSRIVASSSSAVRLPTPISQVPRYGELSFWPPRKPSVTPFASPPSPLCPGKLYRCPLAEAIVRVCFYFCHRTANVFHVSKAYTHLSFYLIWHCAHI